MTYDELWRSLTALYDNGEAKAIVRYVLDVRFGLSATDVYCGKVTQLSADDSEELRKIMLRLQAAEPVQYVLGRADILGRTFHVAPGVLIPRPETEELCAALIENEKLIIDYCAALIENEELTIDNSLRHDSVGNTYKPTQDAAGNFQFSIFNFQLAQRNNAAGGSLLDIGTGSGCIAITLALDLPGAKVTAWDISEEALDIARRNAEELGADVDFRLQDALNPPDDKAVWDVIVSNPPYICDRERAAMERNVLDHEPHTALFVPDDDPLLFYRAITRYARHALKPGGSLHFEINPLYTDDMREMLVDEGFSAIEIRNDQFGKERFIKATLP